MTELLEQYQHKLARMTLREKLDRCCCAVFMVLKQLEM